VSSAGKVIEFPRRRQWKAAQQTRLASGWLTQSPPIDVDVRYGLRSLRSRSREQAQNNDYVRHFLRMCKVHIVGPHGVLMQSKARLANGKPDRRTRQVLEDHWRQWAKLGSCEVTGELSWPDEQRRAVETLARDGEALYRLVRGWPHNRYRFAVQAIDPETLDVDYSESLPNGHAVVMGVEIDLWRRPVAYYLTPDDQLAMHYQHYRKGRVRVPAEDIVHLKLPEWVWQTRGVPWTSTSLLRLRLLDGYEEAAVIAARIGASKMGHYVQTDAEAAEPLVDERDGAPREGTLGDGASDKGEFLESAEPGTFGIAPAGYRFEGWDPTFPNADHAQFIKPEVRALASGIGVGYNSFANDYEGVNLSSLRHSAINERDSWMVLQQYFCEAFPERVKKAWLETSLGVQALTRPNGTALDPMRAEQYAMVEWQPRRWQRVDPDKEAKANLADVQLRKRTISQLIREDGRDPDEVFEEFAEDVKRLQALGIALPSTVLDGSAMSAFAPASGAQLPDVEEEEETDA